MKKIFNYILPVVLFTLVAGFAKANDYGNINVISNGIVKVEVSESAKLHNISISDVNGVQLYAFQDMEAGSYKNLDFTAVPDGRYFIKVENNRTIQTTQVDKTAGVLTVSQTPSLLVKPVFKRVGDKLNVLFMNPTESNVQVDVYDEYNVLINSIQTNDLVIEKALDFSKSLRGNYKVVLAQDSNIFSTDFDY